MSLKRVHDLQYLIDKDFVGIPSLLSKEHLSKFVVSLFYPHFRNRETDTATLEPELLDLTDMIIGGLSKQCLILQERLNKDMANLIGRFGELGDLLEISGPHSDLHDEYATVFFIQFEKKKIVYKPRSLIVDEVFSELCFKYFNIPRIGFVKGENYGWMEFLNADDNREINSFSLGQCIAMLTLLRSSDHHSDNVVISNDLLRFIDLECSFAPEMTFARRDVITFSPFATRFFDNFPIGNVSDLVLGYLDGLKKVRNDRHIICTYVEQLKAEKM